MRRSLALVFILALLAVACGSDDDPVVSDAVTPLDTASPAGPVTDDATDLATDDATDVATEDPTDLATSTTDLATDEATDSPTGTASPSATDSGPVTFSGNEEIVCVGLQAVLDGYEDVLDADPDSDQQREAVELIGQFGREVADFVGADAPELEDALDTLHDNAATIVSEGQSGIEDDEVTDALDTIEQAHADNC